MYWRFVFWEDNYVVVVGAGGCLKLGSMCALASLVVLPGKSLLL